MRNAVVLRLQTACADAQVVFVRNYGVLVAGESVEEAFLTAANVVAAVDTQVTCFV